MEFGDDDYVGNPVTIKSKFSYATVSVFGTPLRQDSSLKVFLK